MDDSDRRRLKRGGWVGMKPVCVRSSLHFWRAHSLHASDACGENGASKQPISMLFTLNLRISWSINFQKARLQSTLAPHEEHWAVPLETLTMVYLISPSNRSSSTSKLSPSWMSYDCFSMNYFLYALHEHQKTGDEKTQSRPRRHAFSVVKESIISTEMGC